MANMNDITEQLRATAQHQGHKAAFDTLMARHTQVLGIIEYILADLADLDEPPTMSSETLSNTLWGVQALLEQAQDAVRQL
jgi:hypothetical protein